MLSILRAFAVVALTIATTTSALAAQRIHTVARGQTLGGIARRYNISIVELREANQLPRGAVLKVGLRLLVPEKGEMERLRQSRAAQAKKADPSKTEAPTEPTTQEAAAAVLEADADAGAPPSIPETADAGADEAAPAGDDGGAQTADAGAPAAPAPAPAPTTKAPVASSAPVSPTTKSSPKVSQKAERKRHVVGSGHTLGKIAKRYNIEIESLCRANGIARNVPLKVGQSLVIPNGDDDPIIESGPPASESSSKGEPADGSGVRTMTVGNDLPVYYYTPTGPGRFGMRPVIVYLHGRGGNPAADCRRWAPIARRFGWLVCPSGPVPYNAGRGWNNSWPAGQSLVMASIEALRKEYGRRVQLYGNTLIGFSEGAYVAMNVGVREPRTFNRWLILGADVSYWGGAGVEALKDARTRVRRVALITGAHDMVVDDTRTVAGWLEKEKVPIRVQTPGELAHEVALERMPGLYESALRWLDQGTATRR